MLPTATVENIIEVIEHFRSRIGMYIQPVDVSNTQSFLTGLAVAASVFGLEQEEGTRWEVQKERAWEKTAVGPVPQMRERGMTELQIINELIAIEIEVMQRSNVAKPRGAA